jgi:zinc finger BED domain-containing protein 5/7/8/9
MDKYVIRSQDIEKGTADNKTKQIKQQSSLKRKYDHAYLEFGFITSESDNSIPFCLLCSATLSNEAMVPSKLSRHLVTKHPEHRNKPKDYFEKIRSNLEKQAEKMKSFCSVSDNAQLASYKIAQLLVKKKKPHTDAETIILPALKIAVDSMISAEAVAKIKLIPLSAETISRRIKDMSQDIDDQLREHFTQLNDEFTKFWALQIDESADISSKAQLLAFLRIIRNGQIENQFFFCSELKETTTGQNIFELVNQNVESRGLKWGKCISICTDGAPSMQGRRIGFVSHALRHNPNIKIVHCMIHREVLVSKALPDQLYKTMNEVIKVVNYIKSNPLRTRIFASLCEAMESDHKCLLFHTDIRWLSKGKVLARVLFLRIEIISYFKTEDTNDFEFLHNDVWWLQVSFLTDIFEKLNSLNLCLQGARENIITITGKLKAFEDKLQLWINKSQNSCLDFLPEVNASPGKIKILREVQETLQNLALAFSKYFPSLNSKQNEWVINPFVTSDNGSMTTAEQESLIDLRNDLVHKASFAEKELSFFWISLRNQYPELSEKAVKSLLPFGSSYLCEFGFSALTEIKSKKRERLQNMDAEMRVCLSNIEPRLTKICSKKHAQISH